MIKTRDLLDLKAVVREPRDLILLDTCIELWKKIEEISEIGVGYLTEGDRAEIITSIMNVVRVYLMIIRDYFKDMGEDDDAIEAVKRDLQNQLSTIFIIQEGKKGIGSTLMLRPIQIATAETKDREIYNIISPFISFVETNIYYAFITANEDISKMLHSKFCELSSKAAGIYKEKEEAELPMIPSSVKKKKDKFKSKGELPEIIEVEA